MSDEATTTNTTTAAEIRAELEAQIQDEQQDKAALMHDARLEGLANAAVDAERIER